MYVPVPSNEIPPRSTGWLVASIGWLVLCGCGFVLLYKYKGTPGAAQPAPAQRSAETAPAGSHLLLFLHPRCPCSSATVAELERLLPHAGRPLQVTVYFYRPADCATAWGKTALWDRTVAIPNVAARWDDDGVAARHFGAQTSGHAVLYVADVLAFSGGITSARGHEGDNPGSHAIVDLLAGTAIGPLSFPVFGCPLVES